MIKVEKNDSCIKIKGHADYDDYGKDIICASVSSIIYTTVNGILNINNKSIIFNDDKDLMEIIIKTKDDITVKLLESMMDLLKDLEKEYPKNIKIV